MKLYSRRVYTASGCKAATIEIEDGRIVSVAEGACPADAVNYGEMRIIPGIFDTHNHGTSGFDLMETGPTSPSVKRLCVATSRVSPHRERSTFSPR